MRTTHTSKSQSQGKSHVSYAKNERDMQREIGELKKELHRARRRRPSLDSELSSEETDDATYRRRSRMRNITISVGIRTQPIRALETMP